MGLGIIVREAEAQLRSRSEGSEAVRFFLGPSTASVRHTRW